MKNLKKSAGFTLVELIVVIAILGILAGVGTVAYTGYVDKAKEAADQQLLSAVNLAFASACIDSGTDMNELTAAEVPLDGDGKVESASPDGNENDEFSKTFFAYFAGNGESAFQRFIRLDFKTDTHLFEGVLPGTTTMDASLTSELLAAATQFSTSNLGKDPETLAKTAGSLSKTVTSILDSYSDLIKDKIGEENWNQFLTDYGIDESNHTAVANGMVLYVAKNLAAVDVTDPNALSGLDEITSSALSLATITAYAKSDFATEKFKEYFEKESIGSLSDIATIYDEMKKDGQDASGSTPTDKGYDNYSNDTDGDYINDVMACINAMKIIDAKQDQFDLTDPNAFDGQDTIDLMRAILAQVK